MSAIFRVRYLLMLRLCVLVSRMQQLHCRREVQKQNEKSANAYTHEYPTSRSASCSQGTEAANLPAIVERTVSRLSCSTVSPPPRGLAEWRQACKEC